MFTFLLNVCRISKSITLPQVTSYIVTFSRMVRFSWSEGLWKAIEITITPVLTILKNIENWPFYSQFRKKLTFSILHPLSLLYLFNNKGYGLFKTVCPQQEDGCKFSHDGKSSKEGKITPWSEINQHYCRQWSDWEGNLQGLLFLYLW